MAKQDGERTFGPITTTLLMENERVRIVQPV